MNNSWLFLEKYKDLSERSQRQLIDSIANANLMQVEEVISYKYEGSDILLAIMVDSFSKRFIFIPGLLTKKNDVAQIIQNRSSKNRYFDIGVTDFFESPNISANKELKRHIKRDIPHHSAFLPPLLVEVKESTDLEWELESIISPKEIADSPKYLKIYQDILQSKSGNIIKHATHIKKQERSNSLLDLFCPSIIEADPADEVEAIKRKYIISDRGLEVYIHSDYTYEASIIRLIRNGYAVLSFSELRALFSSSIFKDFNLDKFCKPSLYSEKLDINMLPKFIRISLDEEASKFSALNLPKFSGIYKAWAFISKAYERESYETVIAAYTSKIILNKNALTEAERFRRIEQNIDIEASMRVIEAFEDNDFQQMLDFFELFHICNQSEDKDYYHYYLIGSAYYMLGINEKAKLYLWLSLSYKYNCASAWRELANIYRREENKDGYYFSIYQLKISMPHMRSALNKYLPKKMKPPYDYDDLWGNFYDRVENSFREASFFNDMEQNILILGFALNYMQNQGILAYFTRSYYKFHSFEIRSHKAQYERILSIISILIESRFVYEAISKEELSQVIESANACRNILAEAWDNIYSLSKTERDTDRLQTLNNIFCIHSVGLRKIAFIYFSNALFFEADRLFDKNYSFSKTYLEDVTISEDKLNYISSLLTSFVDFLTNSIRTYAQIKNAANHMVALLKKAMLSWQLSRHENEVIILSFTHDVGYILKWFNILIDRFELLKGLH